MSSLSVWGKECCSTAEHNDWRQQGLRRVQRRASVATRRTCLLGHSEAVVWPMSEAAAVLLDRSLRLSEHESALEVGWLLAEMEQRFGYGLDELARRFDRSVSWVSRRMALAELLPEAIQQGVIPLKVQYCTLS